MRNGTNHVSQQYNAVISGSSCRLNTTYSRVLKGEGFAHSYCSNVHFFCNLVQTLSTTSACLSRKTRLYTASLSQMRNDFAAGDRTLLFPCVACTILSTWCLHECCGHILSDLQLAVLSYAVALVSSLRSTKTCSMSNMTSARKSGFLAQKTRLRPRLVQMFSKTKKYWTRTKKYQDCSLFQSLDWSWCKPGFSWFRPVFRPCKQ